MSLGTYNGWTGPQRAARLAELRRAERDGTLAEPYLTPPACEICTQTDGTMWHAEQYGPTWEDYLTHLHAVCRYCHAMLHLRFRFPYRWHMHLVKVAEEPSPPVAHMWSVFKASHSWVDLGPVAPPSGDAWFNKVSMERLASPVVGMPTASFCGDE